MHFDPSGLKQLEAKNTGNIEDFYTKNTDYIGIV